MLVKFCHTDSKRLTSFQLLVTPNLFRGLFFKGIALAIPNPCDNNVYDAIY